MGYEQVRDAAQKAKVSAREIATASTLVKNEILKISAENLLTFESKLLEANSRDVDEAKSSEISPTVVDRLRLDEKRISQMAEAVLSVADLQDPVGEIVEGHVRPNGLKVTKVRVPLGVIGIVYENRPNVTSDAAALTLKSGNAVILRGSTSARNSNEVIADAFRQALNKLGLNQNIVTLLKDSDHQSVVDLVSLKGIVDCVIPRGGKGLLESVLSNAKVPVVVDGDGNCHVYVDKEADITMAQKIVINAKMQRPSVCNAMETLLIHRDVKELFLRKVASEFESIEIYGDSETQEIIKCAREATEEDFATEFLDLKLAVKVVGSIEEAIEHVRKYSSGHSEAIVTNDYESANKWVSEVDAAAVLVNCSTRFVDGGELGLGAEIGISTQKLHARGPMGLRDLTSVKYVVYGDGQVRN